MLSARCFVQKSLLVALITNAIPDLHDGWIRLIQLNASRSTSTTKTAPIAATTSPIGRWNNSRRTSPLPLGEGLGGEGDLTKRDIFHYVYAMLHHPAYRERYAENLKRELPRIRWPPTNSPRRTMSSACRAKHWGAHRILHPCPVDTLPSSGNGRTTPMLRRADAGAPDNLSASANSWPTCI